MKRFELYFYTVAGSAKEGFWVKEKEFSHVVTIEGKPTREKLSAAVEIEELMWKMDTEGVWWASSKAGLAKKGMPICELVPVAEPVPVAKPEVMISTEKVESLFSFGGFRRIMGF